MTATSIKDVLAGVLGELKERGPSHYGSATEAWEKVVGSECAKHSEPYALRGKILFVRVDDSTRAFELSRRYKKSIMRRMQHEMGEDQLHDIIFRVGQLSRSHTSRDVNQTE